MPEIIIRPLMSVVTAAKVIGISKRQLHRTIESRDLETYTIGRTMFLRGSLVRELALERITGESFYRGGKTWDTSRLGPRGLQPIKVK